MSDGRTPMERLRRGTALKIASLSDRGEISLTSVERVLREHDDTASLLIRAKAETAN